MQIKSAVLDFLTKNKMLLVYVAGVVACAVALSFLPSCSPKVNVPANIVKEMAVPAEVPLTQAVGLLADYQDECEARVKRNAADIERLSASIEAAEVWQANMHALLWQGIDAASGQAQAIPGLGAVLPLLTGLAGLFIPRPGEGKKIEQARSKAVQETLLAVSVNSSNKVA